VNGHLVFAVAAPILLGANVFASYAVGHSEFYETRQTIVQIALVWLLPLFGLMLVGGVLWSNYERPSPTGDRPEHNSRLRRAPDLHGPQARRSVDFGGTSKRRGRRQSARSGRWPASASGALGLRSERSAACSNVGQKLLAILRQQIAAYEVSTLLPSLRSQVQQAHATVELAQALPSVPATDRGRVPRPGLFPFACWASGIELRNRSVG
jgi:hypothetical protein